MWEQIKWSIAMMEEEEEEVKGARA